MRAFANPDELMKSVGEHIGYSEWREVVQDRVNLFADATDDHQWIHVDPERAQAGPFGTTIAHGFLTLSLVPSLVQEIYRVDGVRMGLNYGLEKVRFPAPLPVGSRIRAGVELLSVQPMVRLANEQNEFREHFGFADGNGQPVLDPAQNGAVYNRNLVRLGIGCPLADCVGFEYYDVSIVAGLQKPAILERQVGGGKARQPVNGVLQGEIVILAHICA